MQYGTLGHGGHFIYLIRPLVVFVVWVGFGIELPLIRFRSGCNDNCGMSVHEPHLRMNQQG